MRVLAYANIQSSRGDPTVWTPVMDREVQSSLSRWSVAAAAFGALCNLLCWALSNYQDFFLLHERLVWSYSFVVAEGLSLAPLLVLFVFRRHALLVFPYLLALLLILMGRVDYLLQYRNFGPLALASKIDSPGFFQILLGGISIAVFLVWAAIRLGREISRKIVSGLIRAKLDRLSPNSNSEKAPVTESQIDREFVAVIAAIAERRKVDRSTAITVTPLFQPMLDHFSLAELKNYVLAEYPYRRAEGRSNYDLIDIEDRKLKSFNRAFLRKDKLRIVFSYSDAWETVSSLHAVLLNDQLWFW